MLLNGTDSTIPKCAHGIFLARPSECRSKESWNCGFCRGNTFNYGIGEPSPLTKTVTDGQHYVCPVCGDASHIGRGKFWKCANCLTTYRGLRQ
jgi:hypothetical protein